MEKVTATLALGGLRPTPRVFFRDNLKYEGVFEWKNWMH